MRKTWTLVGPDGKAYASAVPGTLGGHRRSRIYGRLDCPTALRAIAGGGYVSQRVFFLDAQTARAAGYRPCAVCLPDDYARWRVDPGSWLDDRFRHDERQDTTSADQHEEGDTSGMDRQQLLKRLEHAWTALKASYAGLTEAQMKEPGVMESWSVKDILAHVTIWEEEALMYLPLITRGGKPPRYRQQGGIDAFNARMIEQKRGLPLVEVLHALEETHHRLLDYLQSVPEAQFRAETPFRHRLRLDTYSHYLLHARAIRAWREAAPPEDRRLPLA
jgi:methylphosphotriester-DNA--protein-cysteine methyltransferase